MKIDFTPQDRNKIEEGIGENTPRLPSILKDSSVTPRDVQGLKP